MAIPAPLFSPSLDLLRKELRLEGLPSGGEAEAIFANALLTVRVGFYREIGEAAITSILTTAYTDAPATNAQVVRAVAKVTEVMWVRYELLGALPSLFQDASGNALQVWNEEAPFRDVGADSVAARRSVLWKQIIENFPLLAGDAGIGEEASAKFDDISVDDPTTIPLPFDSIGIVGLE